MRDSRSDTFTVEIPDAEDAPQLARRIERSGGLEAYLGIALDITDDLEAGRYRAALTPTEARTLHAALGAALAETEEVAR